jgi:hypothetical protein
LVTRLRIRNHAVVGTPPADQTRLRLREIAGKRVRVCCDGDATVTLLVGSSVRMSVSASSSCASSVRVTVATACVPPAAKKKAAGAMV